MEYVNKRRYEPDASYKTIHTIDVVGLFKSKPGAQEKYPLFRGI
jgi:hypothetical protein